MCIRDRSSIARGDYAVLCKGESTVKGLILKDIYNIRRNVKMLVLMLVIFGVIFIPQGGGAALIPIYVLLCSMMVVTTISFDDLAKWDKYALTMPVSRNDMVLSLSLIHISKFQSFT